MADFHVAGVPGTSQRLPTIAGKSMQQGCNMGAGWFGQMEKEMTDEVTAYRANGVTVWFEKMPEKSPFQIVSEYGEAATIGRGNSFDEADIYREALEEIMDREGYGRSFDIAERAIRRVSDAQMSKVPA
jgi:hypothetical protein